MKRLPGVVVSAVLLIFGSLLQLLGAAAMGFGAFLIPGLPTSTGTPAHTQPAWLPWFALGIAGVCLAQAAWGIITSVGLFRMRRWARVSALIIGGLLVFFGLPGFLMMILMIVVSIPTPAGIDPAQANTVQMVTRIGFMAIALFYAVISAIGIWWLFYFNRKTVRETFAGSSGPIAPPHRPTLISILAVLNMVGIPICALMAFAPIPLAIFGLVVHGWAKAALLLAFGTLAGISGVGLWRLQEWGRGTAIACQLLGLTNNLFFIFRPAIMLHYQEEVNRTMSVPQTAQLPAHFQSTIQYLSLGFGIFFVLAVITILHYYRGAFKPAPNPSTSQPELIS
jgi:uncharacterized membrane protein (DUF2068 family)